MLPREFEVCGRRYMAQTKKEATSQHVKEFVAGTERVNAPILLTGANRMLVCWENYDGCYVGVFETIAGPARVLWYVGNGGLERAERQARYMLAQEEFNPAWIKDSDDMIEFTRWQVWQQAHRAAIDSGKTDDEARAFADRALNG